MYKRIVALFFVFAGALIVLVTRLAIINESDYKTVSGSRNTMSVVLSESRGYIYDCNMKPLVNAQTTYKIAIKPSVAALVSANSVLIDTEKERIFNAVSSGTIGVGSATAVIENKDVVVSPVVSRYSDDGLCVHLIGYTDVDGNGVTGIEKYYNEILSDAAGSLRAKCTVDAMGRILDGVAIELSGENYNCKKGVALTIDSEIQQICENSLIVNGIDLGAVVVLDVKTSQIRAMASAPEFSQNNVAASLDDSNSPFINRAITPYSVGSVFKAVVACAAIESGIKTDTKFNCNGYTLVGQTRFGCHNETGHGTVDMTMGMAFSCNPYFINLALKTGAQQICNMGENLGLGSAVELADGFYAPGGIMPEAQSLVSPQDIANIAFGQGRLLASPLQMAAVYAAIANDGVYRTPSLMNAIVDEHAEAYMSAELPVPRRVMSIDSAKTVQQLLYVTVVYGSGSKAKPDGIEVAGKTATAQSGQFDEAGNEITQSWFCGYFPYENPEYAVCVLKENGAGGSADCTPVFRYIAENITKISGQ